MEDHSILRNLDGFVLPVEQHGSTLCFQNMNNFIDQNVDIKSLQTKEMQRASIAVSMANCVPHRLSSSNEEHPSKCQRLHPWDGNFKDELNGNSFLLEENFHCSPCFKPPYASITDQHQHQHQHQQQQQQQQQQQYYSQAKVLFDTSGSSNEKAYGHIASEAGEFQLDFGCSQRCFGQESCLTDAYPGGISGTKDMVLSPSESIHGGRKPRPFLNDMNLQRFDESKGYTPLPPAKPPGHSQDHIMAERKRREKLSQQFIALSALVPGLKKMDKASVLGDTIKYVKLLQERLNQLEEQISRGSVAVVSCAKKKKRQEEFVSALDSEDSSGSSCDADESEKAEIEVRVLGKDLLVRVHCKKKQGVLGKCLLELEKLRLVVINASILSFTDTTLDLTLTAQMEKDCDLTGEDTVKALQSIFRKLK